MSLAQIVPLLQSLVQQISALVQSLTAQLGSGGNTAAAQADAGANTLGGGAGSSGSVQASGGCGCGGAAGAVAGASSTGDVPPSLDPSQTPDSGGAAAAPKASVSQSKQQSKKNTKSSGAKAAPASTTPSNVPSNNEKDLGKIKAYIKQAAAAYGANPQILENIAKGESTFNNDAINKTDINAQRGHPSEGMFQFIPKTFEGFSKEAKAANPKAWEGLGDFNFHDWRQQALTTAWGITHGHTGDWATWTKAKADAGA